MSLVLFSFSRLSSSWESSWPSHCNCLATLRVGTRNSIGRIAFNPKARLNGVVPTEVLYAALYAHRANCKWNSQSVLEVLTSFVIKDLHPVKLVALNLDFRRNASSSHEPQGNKINSFLITTVTALLLSPDQVILEKKLI